MGVRLRKRNGAWWVFIDYHGKRKAKKVGSREAGEAVRRKLEARLAEGDLGCLEERTVPVFRDYSERWLKECAELECKASTVGFYRQCLKLHVEPKFGELRLDAITRDQVKAWIASLCEEGYARNTVRLAVTTLRTILNAAREDGLIATNPADKLGRFVKTEKPPQEATALTREETQALLDKAKETCSVRDYALVLCALRAGLRRGELVTLRWGGGTASSVPTKTIPNDSFWCSGTSITAGPGTSRARRARSRGAWTCRRSSARFYSD